MAAGGNDIIESSNEDATVDRKLRAAGEPRDRETSPAVNDRKWNAGAEDGTRLLQANRPVLDANNRPCTLRPRVIIISESSENTAPENYRPNQVNRWKLQEPNIVRYVPVQSIKSLRIVTKFTIQ